MNSLWLPLIEEAGFAATDVPTTQDKFHDFLQSVEDKLRSKGKRIFGLGFSMAAKEADAGNLFHQFLVNYGGVGIVTPEGKLNIDDPVVRKAATTTLERLTTPFKKGYVPPGSINWGDVDNNNAFFAKQIVMTPNATISIAAAQMDKPDLHYKEIITRGPPWAMTASRSQVCWRLPPPSFRKGRRTWTPPRHCCLISSSPRT